MSKDDVKQHVKSAYFRLAMGAKLVELAEVVGDYHNYDPNSAKLPGEKLASYYGFRTDPRNITETKTFEEIVKNLDILSIQNMNLLRFHERAEEISDDLLFDCSKLLKAPLDSKLLIYIKSRIEFNSKMFGLDANYFPKKLCTYNECMLNMFKNANKTFVLFDTFKDLADAPSKRIVKKMKIEDKAYIGRVLVCKASYVKRNADYLLSQRKIALLY